jgi:hypothetical protein
MTTLARQKATPVQTPPDATPDLSAHRNGPEEAHVRQSIRPPEPKLFEQAKWALTTTQFWFGTAVGATGLLLLMTAFAWVAGR